MPKLIYSHRDTALSPKKAWFKASPPAGVSVGWVFDRTWEVVAIGPSESLVRDVVEELARERGRHPREDTRVLKPGEVPQ